MSDIPVGARVRVMSYGGLADGGYTGQEGTVQKAHDPDYIEVRLDSELHIPNAFLPCLPEELEVLA